jgi:hypothetical protein
MWKNWHVVAALLVAPVLAILAWFAVDWFVAERPHEARPGQDYPLMAKSNCRWPSGACDLVNESFRLTLTPAARDGTMLRLRIESRFPLSAAAAGLAPRAGAASQPVAFAPAEGEDTVWSGTLPAPGDEGATLQIVVTAAGSRYFAEVPVVFLAAE